MDSPDRTHFLADLKPGGKYENIVGIFRKNFSAVRIGVFDKEIIYSLADVGVKWIAHCGAGYDKIDILACKEKGAVDDATATTALYLMISSLRQFSKAERDVREGLWKSRLSSANAFDITGRTLAILGLGGIGMRLAELAHVFPMRIVYHSRRKRDDVPDWCEYFPEDRLNEMLGITDVLSIHVPLRKETEGLVGDKMIRALKKGAIIVNTARGKVIDEDAMIEALEDGHLGAVGLDVHPNEPELNPRVLELPQVTLLPHVGTATFDSQKNMELRALNNLRDFLVKGRGTDLVPEML
ncbi:hypothetical protein EW026_g1433 [Hermanssonia centrifuga]|uniref:Hydroxyphenylpyruvate reductase n=1 Tax=Hermanssonia centrifuga TaxID=98765 RepID=A0A4V3XB96_9APHY|nr:hypothetical protein EW026_g1433 [Hermanssonia centrifuga]